MTILIVLLMSPQIYIYIIYIQSLLIVAMDVTYDYPDCPVDVLSFQVCTAR